MSSKNGLIISSLFLIASLLTSCLGKNEYDEIPDAKDAEILSFSLSSDSVSALSSVVFSIDQDRNLIYNRDSMAYLTEIKYKVIVKYTSAEGTNLKNITEGDSTWVKSGDSIDVSKPLRLQAFSSTGSTTKIYAFQLNIHQIDPDSVQYYLVASDQAFLQAEEIQTVLFKNNFYTFTYMADAGIKLYGSSDAVSWSEIPLSGLPDNAVVRGIKSNGEKLFAYTSDGDYYESAAASSWSKIDLDYPVVSILGYLKLGEGQVQLKEGLSLIVKKDNQAVFAYLSDNQWTFGDVAPSGFPVSDFAGFNNERMKLGYLTVMGGLSATGEVLNDTWSTGNGLYWAKLTNAASVLPPLRGANVIWYNNEYWVLNGKQTDGTYNEGVYSSIDGGTTWSLRAEKCFYPEDYPKRYGASAVVDGKGEYFYVLGGKNDGFLPEIWKGFLNKKIYASQ